MHDFTVSLLLWSLCEGYNEILGVVVALLIGDQESTQDKL